MLNFGLCTSGYSLAIHQSFLLLQVCIAFSQVASELELVLVGQLDPAAWTGLGCVGAQQSLGASFQSPCLGASRTQLCWMCSSPSLCCRLLPCAVNFQSEMEVQSCLLHREGKGEGGRGGLLFPCLEKGGNGRPGTEQPGRAEMTQNMIVRSQRMCLRGTHLFSLALC